MTSCSFYVSSEREEPFSLRNPSCPCAEKCYSGTSGGRALIKVAPWRHWLRPVVGDLLTGSPGTSVGPCRIAGGGDGGSTVLRSGGEGGAAALGAPNGWLVRGTRVRGKSQSERGIKNGEGRGGQVLSVQAGVSLTGCWLGPGAWQGQMATYPGGGRRGFQSFTAWRSRQVLLASKPHWILRGVVFLRNWMSDWEMFFLQINI